MVSPTKLFMLGYGTGGPARKRRQHQCCHDLKWSIQKNMGGEKPMTYVMSKRQYNEYIGFGFSEEQILEEINRTRSLRGQFTHIAFEG